MRVARAANHLRATLMAGFTTIRDLGTEGAGYADVGLKQAVDAGDHPGPRMLVDDARDRRDRQLRAEGLRARVARAAGRRGGRRRDARPRRPRPDRPRRGLDQGLRATTAGARAARRRRRSRSRRCEPIVETARSSGRPVVAHASTPEGMRRAVLAGVETIEHGDGGTPEVFKLMAERSVALCPTLAAGDAIAQYAGWKKGQGPEPAGITRKRASFKAALAAGVTILQRQRRRRLRARRQRARAGADGRTTACRRSAALKSATSVAARVLHMEDRIGPVEAGPARGSRRRRRRSRRATSRRCAGCGS